MRGTAAVVLLALLAGCASPTDSGEDDAAPAAVEPESAVEAGRLTAAEATSEHAFPIQAGHGRLAVTLVLTTAPPETQVVLNVTGPSTNGREADTEPLLGVFPGLNPTLSFDLPAAGAWTARVDLGSGAAADYEVHWCADSADTPGPKGNLACHRSYA